MNQSIVPSPSSTPVAGAESAARLENEVIKRPMSAVVENLRTTSDKIRALLREGYQRTEVAYFLDIRYQHVRRVAVDAGIEGGLKRGIVVVPRSKATPKIREDVAIKFLADAGFKNWALGYWTTPAAFPRCAGA